MPAVISGFRPVWSESQPVSELAGAPDDRVGGGDDRDLAHAGAVGGEVERRQAPGERVVEVVDEPGLAAGAQDRVAQARVRERAAELCALARSSPWARCSSATWACVSRTAEDARSSRPAAAISAAPTQTTVRGA